MKSNLCIRVIEPNLDLLNSQDKLQYLLKYEWKHVSQIIYDDKIICTLN